MAVTRPRVFTIPASTPFLPTLIKALVEGRLVPRFPAAGDPLALASATIYLPTRRACRLARDLFLDALGQDSAILPRLLPVGDIDEDELAFAEAASGPLAEAALDMPEPLGGLERRLLLAQLVLRWAQELSKAGNPPLIANSPAGALALADALARLMDDMTTREVSWDKLDSLVPNHLDRYWDLTLNFLRIAREAWPAILAERGAIEPAERRDRLIAAEAKRLAGMKDGPVIAAGSTASMPATAELLATIAKLPHGAVVLPGLDTSLDEMSWDLIGGVPVGSKEETIDPAVGHPQFAMQAFLAKLGMRREEVATLGGDAHARDHLASEALRPAAATDLWNKRLDASTIEAALANVSVIEAANTEEEAFAIAVALREAVEEKDATAALVTPDRGLARRVVAALRRWKVDVDDSGGDALADTPAGIFARLAAEAALGGLEPVTLLALLKHPLLRLGSPHVHAFATSVLERALLRGPRPRKGSAGLAHALAALRENKAKLHGSDPRRRISDGQLDTAEDLVKRLTVALAPLEKLPRQGCRVSELAKCHLEVIEGLAGKDDAFAADDGTQLGEVLVELRESVAAQTFALSPAEYPEFFHGAISERVVRRPGLSRARVRVYGLLEARLQNVDRIVLGGLVEGTWPPQTRSDPWLSRPMRQQLGLDLPERRIGLTAHDFAQALGAREVVLSHAAKVGGTPSVESRFMQRLAAVAGVEAWAEAKKSGARYVELARHLDRPQRTPKRIKAPSPKPPRAARPSRLSVTEIEHWLRDPYTIYAKHVLRLAPLDPVDTPPGARDRGTMIHGAVGDFTARFAAELPANAAEELLRFGREYFAPLEEYDEAKAFWWPRFERVTRWFVNWERQRRPNVRAVYAEKRGELKVSAGKREFILSTRADRIEQRADGTFAILDYKTGTPPSDKQVRTGLNPQLTLEATILRHGKFEDVPSSGSVSELSYVALRGGEPAGLTRIIDLKDRSPDQHADATFLQLKRLVEKFEDEAQPYLSLVRPMWRTRAYGDYDHLARVREWSATGGEDDAEAIE
jgi:ATP-dependent helicase/nuclease subunit B